MRLLALDSSSRRISVSLFVDGALKATKAQDAPLRANEVLAVLAQGALGGGKVGAVAACLGPGSFSGLRSGLGFAKAYAFASQCPLFGISGLDAWASYGSGELEVWLDARKEKVYRGRYHDGAGTADLVELATARAGAHGEIYGDLEGLKGLPQGAALSEAVGRLALKRMEKGGADEAALLAPLYLQRPAHEVLWEKRGGK